MAVVTPPQETIESQKRVINALQHEVRWYEALLSNTGLNELDMRLLVRNTPREVRMGLASEVPERKIYLPAVAEEVHAAPQTVSTHLRKLEKAGAFSYRRETDPASGNTRVYLTPQAIAETPDKIELDRKPRGGSVWQDGKRIKRCGSCGSANLLKRTQVQCQDCGSITSGDWKPVNPDDDPDSQYDSEPPDPDSHIGSEGADEENLESSPSTIPSTPPVVASTLSDTALSPEQEAAQLLLDIAGPTATHILMTNRVPDEDGTYPTSRKYVTLPGSLTVADTLAHIRGEKTVGDFLRHEGGQARAACYDGDGSADWQRLQDAARMLAIVGFKPLLEACPMDCASGSLHAGGGRLWVIIDALVDAYSLHQTLYQYAPILKDIKESWPAAGGNRVRLPGGKYRQGDRAEWCKLYDANEQELSADGPGAARVLLENQASANLVNEYVKPEPVILPERTERAQGQGGYLDSDLVKRVIADFNATHSWATIAGLCGGFNKRGFFLATWRNERNPSVSVFDKTDMAKDFGVKEPSMDRYDVWCRIHGGAQWEAWKKRDVAERCQAIRDAQEQGQSASPPLTAPVNERPATPIPTPSDALFAAALPDPSYRAYYEQMGKWA